MRRLKVWWRGARSPRIWDELETWAGVLLTLGAALLLYATLKAQAAQADEFPRDVGAPTLLFQAADGSYSAAAPLQTDLRISVAGVVARVRVAQRFRNTGSSFVEAVYVLPLPDDAAVDRLSMQSASASSKARSTSGSRPSASTARRARPASARASCGKRARTCSRRPSPTSRPARRSISPSSTCRRRATTRASSACACR